jgi:hypothetical protein
MYKTLTLPSIARGHSDITDIAGLDHVVESLHLHHLNSIRGGKKNGFHAQSPQWGFHYQNGDLQQK